MMAEESYDVMVMRGCPQDNRRGRFLAIESILYIVYCTHFPP